MGNRATVIFTDGGARFSPAVYLHWNGGPESVYAFLEELDRREVRADQDYECARFIQLVGEFFDHDGQGGYSLGVANGPKAINGLERVETDHSDNGFYLVNRTGHGGVPMRRFIENGSWEAGYKLVEQAPGWVERERDAARAHEYRPSLREFYLKLGTGRKTPLGG